MSSGESSTSGTTRSAVEDPNTLRSKAYAKIVDLAGEGEWEEVCVGGLKGLYLDGVVAQNPDGSNNFSGITLETRNGSLYQSRMNIANTTESTSAVGIEMKYNQGVEQIVYGESIDYIRATVGVSRLSVTDTTTGDLKGTSVSYRIEYKDSASSTWKVVPSQTATPIRTPLTYGAGATIGYEGYEIHATIYPSRYFTANEILAPCYYYVQASVNGGSWENIKQDIAYADTNIVVEYITSTGSWVDFQIITSDSPSFVPEGQLTSATFGQITEYYGINYGSDSGVQTISGKTTSAYERQHSFRVSGTSPFTVRLTRLTADSTSEYVQNTTVFQAVSAVTEEHFVYPGSVLIGTYTDATQFSSIPARSFRCKMLRVKVPNNYDPLTRQYSGFWNGGWKIAWTDNPAWCFRDLLTNKRYGLGERIPESYVDDASLYEIAQYCDTYVPNGVGGYEPRFTCNLYIQTQREAYKVISDMASIFRGITYWATGSIVPVQDSAKGVAYAFNNTNVEDGIFSYQGSDINTRYNAVTVTWNDPNNAYKQVVEYVADDDAISAMGFVNQTNIVAFGCTSRGMARRAGKWLLYTNTYETDVVSFVTGLEGAIPKPGDVIQIADSLRAAERRGGRIVSGIVADGVIGAVLDTEMAFIQNVKYTLTYIDTDGKVGEVFFYASGITDTIYFDSTIASLTANSIFVIADDDIPQKKFRVISITEREGYKYEISAVTYNEQKYSYVEYDERIIPSTEKIVYVNPVSTVTTTETLYAEGVTVKSKLRLDWTPPAKAVAYELYITAPDGERLEITQKQTYYEVTSALEGKYQIKLTALDVIGHRSAALQQEVIVLGKSAPPNTPTNLAVKSFDGQGQVSWDMHPDLDVRVGGTIIIKHTSKTASVTWEDGVVVAVAPGGTTQISVPLLLGTYTAKAVDEGGRYSKGFAVAGSSFASVQGTNAMAVLVESPTFTGEKINCFVDVLDDVLILNAEKKWDDIVLIDSVETIDYLGAGDKTATYYFSAPIDLTGIYTVRAFGNITGYATVVGDTINSRLTPINTWARFNGERIDGAVIKLFIALTDNAPSDPDAVWSDWQEFVLSDYTARGFKFKLEMSVENTDHQVQIVDLSVSVDAVDRVVGQDNVTVPATGFTIVFDGEFATTPAIAISIDNMQNGDYYRLTSKSAAGFTAQIFNSSNVAVSRQIDWIAKGYGRKV